MAFGGPVGKKPGQLEAALSPKTREGQFVTAVGVYNGPNNSALGALFVGVTVDGAQNIHMMRTLFSSQQVLDRYDAAQTAFMSLMSKRSVREAGRNIVSVPAAVKAKITPGGELVPGVYAGNQYSMANCATAFGFTFTPTASIATPTKTTPITKSVTATKRPANGATTAIRGSSMSTVFST